MLRQNTIRSIEVKTRGKPPCYKWFPEQRKTISFAESIEQMADAVPDSGVSPWSRNRVIAARELEEFCRHIYPPGHGLRKQTFMSETASRHKTVAAAQEAGRQFDADEKDKHN